VSRSRFGTTPAFDAALSVVHQPHDKQALWTGHLKAQGLSLKDSEALWMNADPTDEPDAPFPLDHLAATGPHLSAARISQQVSEHLARYDQNGPEDQGGTPDGALKMLGPRALTYELYGFLLSRSLPAHPLIFAAARLGALLRSGSQKQRDTLKALRTAPPFPVEHTSTAQLRGLWKRLNATQPFERLHRLHLSPSLAARAAIRAETSGHESEVWLYLIDRHTLTARTSLQVRPAEPFRATCLKTDVALGHLGPHGGLTLLYLIRNEGAVSEMGGFAL